MTNLRMRMAQALYSMASAVERSDEASTLVTRTRAYMDRLGLVAHPKIEAIKYVRREAGMSLKDSKEFVEKHFPEFRYFWHRARG